MPGHVVDFWIWQKEKAAGKAALVCKIFTCILSDLDVIYRYVARHGRMPLWFQQQFRRTGIETILFFIMPRLGTCLAWWMLCAWYLEQFPRSRIETIVFLVAEKERVRCLIFPALFLRILHSSFLIVIYPIYFNFLKSGKIA